MESFNGECQSKNIYKTIDSIPFYYFKIKNSINICGYNTINEFNFNYIIGKYLIYIHNIGYIYYDNVYYEFKSPLYNPQILYKNNNQYIIWDPYKLLNETELDDVIFIYFTKVLHDNSYYLNVYNNSNLQIQIKIKEVLRKLPDNCLLIKLENEQIEIYNYVTNTWYPYKGSSYNTLANFYNSPKNFYTFHTNININLLSNLIDNNLKNILQNIPIIKNTSYKRIYFHNSINIHNKVFFNYIKNNFNYQKVNNEFEDDKCENFMILIDRNNKESISFIEYVMNKSHSFERMHSYHYTIYSYPIEDLILTLFSDFSFKMKIIDYIKNDSLFIIEDISKKEEIIDYIYNNLYIFKDDTKYNLCNKLMKKYNTNTIGLFIILLAKYGEEVAFNFPTFEDINLNANLKKNQEIYNTIFLDLEEKDIKWKSEFYMYKLIKSYFKDAIFQYRFKELGLQSLDVFIPSLSIAFEYQGKQHYEAINFFGR